MIEPIKTCEWCGSDEECDCEERSNCKKYGTWGHKACGWCKTHKRPIFLCPISCRKKPKGVHDGL